MKNFLNIFLVLIVISTILTSCVEDQRDLRYSGPTVAEFKNAYLERQLRMGTTHFSTAYPSIITLENTSLTKLTVRQPSMVMPGTITTATNSVNVTGSGTAFLTELEEGSVLRNSAMQIIGTVASITDNTNLVLNANATVAGAGISYRASFIPLTDLVFSDSILVQMIGRQVSSDISVTYITDFNNPLTPTDAEEAIEGIHYDFVRNEAGELVVKGNSNSGYIYLNVYDGLGGTDANRVVLMLTLTDDGDVAPSENYKTFTYNIIK